MEKISLESWGVPPVTSDMQIRVVSAAKILHDGSGAGADARGWLDLPTSHDTKEFAQIIDLATKVREDGDVFITVGIGGSYLGTRAVVHALRPLFKKDKIEMLYAGNHLSSRALAELLEYVADKSVYVNVISKSGTTLEPALAFRLLRDMMEKRYGEDEARRRIIATTDRERGALKKLAQEKGYETFVVPDDVGGRYSVLSAVGLLPIAVAGVDIDALIKGAQQAQEVYNVPYEDNPCYQYAALRNALYEDDKKTEILVSYEPGLQYFNEWWKQLFGESEGKDKKGLLPSSLQFTTDLHSLGQYVQEGERIMFETVIDVADSGATIDLHEDANNYDGLNYLVGKSVHDANTAAREGTRAAHLEGGVPQIRLTIPRLDAFHMGEMIYFFEKACGVSAYTLGVNPFNQPGVEAYKQKMFALLGK